MLIGKVATVVPGTGHGLGWWPVILFDMMSMSIRIGEAERGQVCVTVLGDDVHAHRQGSGCPAA